MVDIETLGTKVDSPIIEIGVGLCRDKGDDGIHFESSSHVVGVTSRAVGDNFDTVKWHLQQPSGGDLVTEALKSPHTVSGALRKCLDELQLDLTELQAAHIPWYAQGPQFDYVMLERQLVNAVIPWKYYMLRDLRTIDKVLGGDVVCKDRPNAHRAADDCQYQMRRLVDIFTARFGESVNWPE